MEIDTNYGEYFIKETATGISAENMSSGVLLFIDGRWMPNPDHTMDVQTTIEAVEAEYEFQHDLKA